MQEFRGPINTFGSLTHEGCGWALQSTAASHACYKPCCFIWRLVEWLSLTPHAFVVGRSCQIVSEVKVVASS